MDHRTVGTISLPGPPLRFEAAAGTAAPDQHAHQALPTLGQYDASVRAWLDGLDAQGPVGL